VLPARRLTNRAAAHLLEPGKYSWGAKPVKPKSDAKTTEPDRHLAPRRHPPHRNLVTATRVLPPFSGRNDRIEPSNRGSPVHVKRARPEPAKIVRSFSIGNIHYIQVGARRYPTRAFVVLPTGDG
jgi:hypothetical protein